MTTSDYLDEPGFRAFEVESDESDVLEIVEDVPNDIASVFVLMESEDQIVEAHIDVQGADIADRDTFVSPRENTRQRVFVQTMPDAGEHDTVNPPSVGIRARVQTAPDTKKPKRSRILVVLLRRGARWLIEHLSCRGCKKLVKTIISTILGSLGIVEWPLNFDWQFLPDDTNDVLQRFGDVVRNLCEGAGDAIMETPPINDLLNLLDNPIVRRILDMIRQVIDGITQIYDVYDNILTAICRRLGFCD